MMRKPLAAFLAATLVLAALGAAAHLLQAEAAAPAATKNIAGCLQPFVEKNVVSGAVVLVATKQKVLGVGAVGYADVAARKPMQTDTVFWIASQTKPVTATALMMLVDEGKVSIDDPVEKYLPEFKGQMVVAEQDADHVLLKRPGHPITVKEVLSHTSGLPFLSKQEGGKIDALTLREAIFTYALAPLKFEPGSKYEYSNCGINVAGRIIEVVSGMPYEEFMDKRLFKPLGMKDTAFWPTEEQVGRLAKNYKANAAKTGLDEAPIGYMTYPLTDHRRGVCPGGGLFSTAADVGIFCRMILAGGVYEGKRYVSEASIRVMTSTQTGKDEGGYGLGWATTRRMRGPTGPVIVGECSHGGACATDMRIDPARQIVTVLMVQRPDMPGPDGGAIRAAVSKAAAEALGK